MVRSEAMVNCMNQLQVALRSAPTGNAMRQCNACAISDCLHFLEMWTESGGGLLAWDGCLHTEIFLLPPAHRVLSYMNLMMDALDLSVLLNRIALHHACASPRLHTSHISLSRHGLK